MGTTRSYRPDRGRADVGDGEGVVAGCRRLERYDDSRPVAAVVADPRGEGVAQLDDVQRGALAAALEDEAERSARNVS